MMRAADRKKIEGELFRLKHRGLTWEDVPIVECLDEKILAAIKDDPYSFNMAQWHSSCGTTHCRAGWAIFLSGAAGAALEDAIGPEDAGVLIYAKSCPGEPIPLFFGTNREAIVDMRRRAHK